MAMRLGKLGFCVSARSMAKPVRTLGIVLCGSWFLVAGGGGASSPTPPTLQSISVSPQNGTVAAGITQQFSATGHYSDGSSNTVSSVTCATSNASVATINSTGLLTAVKQGPVTISATSAGITGNSAVTIGPPNLLSISVSPQNPTVSAGGTQQFTATGTYSDGSTQAQNGATWSSGRPQSRRSAAVGLQLALPPEPR